MFSLLRLFRGSRLTVWSLPLLFLSPIALSTFNLFNPVLVKDINPAGDAFPIFLTPAGDVVYFYADTGEAKQLFVANQQGVTQLTSLAGGTGHIDHVDHPAPIQMADCAIYFLVDANDDWGVDQVWRTDGTPAGTKPIMLNDIRGLSAAAEGFYALAGDGNGYWGVWYSDGSEAGAKLLQGGFDSMTTSIIVLGVFDGHFYFAMTKPMGRTFDLWRADTNSATLLVSTTLRGWVHGAVYQNTLYIADRSGEIWRLPAGSDTPVMWQDGSRFYGSVSRMYATDERLYLIGLDISGQYTQTLWRYDGASGNFEEIATYTEIRGVTGMGDSLYYTAEQYTEEGVRLGGSYFLRLPLTATTPISVSPVFTTPGDLIAEGLKTDGNLLYMQVSKPGASELWVSDGSASGTRRVTNTVQSYENWGSATCPCIAVAGGEAYFDRQDPDTGVELWTLEREEGKSLYLPHLAR